MTTQPKEAVIRFYFDEDLLGLAKVIAGLRNDCTFPGDAGAVIHKRQRAACPVPTRSKDWQWIPQVGRLGWLIVTRDHNIRETPSERRLVREHDARMVALSGRDAADKWGQLEVLMTQWRAIEKLTVAPPPFIYLASRSGLRSLDLTDDGTRRSRRTRGGVTRRTGEGLDRPIW